MSKNKIAIVFDIGASNARVVAIDTGGTILAIDSKANEVDDDPHYKNGKIWDIDKLWEKLSHSSREVMKRIDPQKIAGVTITTFGVDGTFIDKEGKLLYPVISWQCTRTENMLEKIKDKISLEEIYSKSAVYPYAFNTINKFIWFKENRPDIIEKADKFIFMPSLLALKLTGVAKNDYTMIGTSMMNDLAKRHISSKIFSALEIPESIFGNFGEPGDMVGFVTEKASQETGLPEKLPLFLAGHDSQFAVFGSGAELNQPVLSSGTWEVILSRSNSFNSTQSSLDLCLTTEADPIPGVYNIGQNWLGAGVLEWFSDHFYPNLEGDELYEKMIADAEKVSPGAGDITVNPAFYKDSLSSKGGVIRGLTLDTKPAMLYRAFLEGLSFRLREGLEAIENAGSFKAEKIICVGGGSKNRLWNQIRADVTGLPIVTIAQKETTVLGASFFVFAAASVSKSAVESRKKVDYSSTTFKPSKNKDLYNRLYVKYKSSK